MKLNLQSLNLNALLHFHSIAKHRSLSLAAVDLHLSPPAITHSLNKLEDTLGETLCIRTRTSFELTTSGARLYQATQRIFQELDAFAQSQVDETQYDGILSIGILDHFENEKFVKALEKVVQKFPNLKLNVQSYDSETINKLVTEGELALGLGVFSRRSSKLKYVKIGEEALRYYISSNHPLWKKKKIQKEDLIGLKTTWLDNQNRKRSDLELNVFVTNQKYRMQFYAFSNNLSGALPILLSGHAVVPLPENYGDSIAKQYPIRKIDVTTRHRSLDQMLAYNPSGLVSPASKLLIEEILRDLK